MKIVHLIGYFQPEFGYKEYYIARNQAKLGHDVYVITSDRVFPFPNYHQLANRLGLPSTRRRQVGITKLDGITIIRLPAMMEFKSAIIVRGVKRALKKIKPKLVYTYEPSQLTPLFAAFYKSIGYSLLVDHQQFEVPRTILGKLFFYCVTRFLSKYILNKADRVIFTTPEAIEFAIKWFAIKQNKTFHIPLGYDRDFFHFNELKRHQIRQKLGVRHNELLLVTTGKIEKSKKIEHLVALVDRLNRIHVKLLILGSGDNEYLGRLKATARELGLGSRVIFHEFVDRTQLYKYFCASDIGIWPDSPTISVIEAIGCHLPVIVPDRAALLSLIEDGNGVSFRRNSSGDLLEIVRRVVDNPVLLHDMKSKARFAAEMRFDYQRIAQQIIDLV